MRVCARIHTHSTAHTAHTVHTHTTQQGVLKLGQEIEVRPGIITKDAEGRVKCIPIYSRVVSLFAEGNELHYAVPGGLIGVGLTVGGVMWLCYVLCNVVRGVCVCGLCIHVVHIAV